MRPLARSCLLPLASVLLFGPARGQSTERVSVGQGLAQATDHAAVHAISADGRFVVFGTAADHLVPGDTNGLGDVFVRDRQSGTIELVSVNDAGVQAESGAGTPSMSADGRYVAFVSSATNLVAGDTNNVHDVFVRDRLLATTVRASLAWSGAQALGSNCLSPAISADGRFVSFQSSAANLVPGDTNGRPDIFLRDLRASTTHRVSVGSDGVQGSGWAGGTSSISADGRFVAFDSGSVFAGTGDQNIWHDVFVRDREFGTTERLSVGFNGLLENFHSGAASISDDGRFVAFVSRGSTLVAGDTNDAYDCFVRDRQTSTTERVSVSTSGAQGDWASTLPRISADGRFVAFQSGATNFGPTGATVLAHVFAHDRQTGITQLVSVSTSGAPGNSNCERPQISSNGRFVAFTSFASNLVVGDTNGFADAFVHDQLGTLAPSSFCSGDGGGTTCPCGPGAPGDGCPNSVNARGARLAASGASSLVKDSLILTGAGMPDGTALYFQGTSRSASGGILGDGLHCLAGSIVRLGIVTNSGGASRYPDAGDPAVSIAGDVSTTGARVYQVWYRDAVDYCSPAKFNTTNGVSATWTLF